MYIVHRIHWSMLMDYTAPGSSNPPVTPQTQSNRVDDQHGQRQHHDRQRQQHFTVPTPAPMLTPLLPFVERNTLILYDSLLISESKQFVLLQVILTRTSLTTRLCHDGLLPHPGPVGVHRSLGAEHLWFIHPHPYFILLLLPLVHRPSRQPL